MGKIVIEYDEDELKVMITSILAEKLMKSTFINSDMMRRQAQKKAEAMLVDKIMKELEQA